MTALLVGAYGPDMDGSATGITPVVSDADGIRSSGAVLEAESPSWIAVRGDRMVATGEGSGDLFWFARVDGAWTRDGVTATGGGYPCHAVFLDDDTVAVACYGDGPVVLARHGCADPVQRLDGEGSGPLAAQEGPHAHHVHVLPDGRVLTLDLGADRVHIHERSTDGLLRRVDSLALPPGTGPRDLLALPHGGLVLLGEWSCELVVLEPAGHTFEVAQILVLPGATPGSDQAAALGLTADGRFVVAGLRGADRVAVVALEDDGLRAVGSVPSGGSWPRHLLVDGEYLHVANQLSDRVTTFRIGSDGMPVELASFATASPTCVVKNTADSLLG